MRRPLIIAAAVLAAANTAAEVLNAHGAVYLLKPLATLALVAITLGAATSVRYRQWIAAGLCASLAGDILLMLPQGLFVPGLVVFLIGHLLYITAFATDGARWRAARLAALPVYGIALAVLMYLWPTLGARRVPVACYVAVISTMAWLAIARWRARVVPGAALAAAGGLFFLASDSALAIRRFVAPYPSATLLILVTYYAAQWCLAFSVVQRSRATD
jgi:uncharacterized membrane protein YhhN